MYTPVHAQAATDAAEPASTSTYTVSVVLGAESAVLTITVGAGQLVAVEGPAEVEVGAVEQISAGEPVTHTWSAAEADYYTALVDAHRTLGDAATGAMRAALFGESTADADASVTESRQAIYDLVPPARLLAVDSLARFAANYCRDVSALAVDAMADEQGVALMYGTVYAWLDRCRFALRDVKVEAARFAALHGGYPPAVLAADPTLVE